MAVYRRQTVVDAPLAEVWAVHSRASSLPELTPGWMHFRVESVSAPAGRSEPDALAEGSVVRIAVRPFRVLPEQSWTSVITDLETGDRAAFFRDVMEDGPFPTWIHTHRFEATAEGTRITDRVAYELPWPLRPISPVAWPFFEALFTYRHRRLKRRLE